MFAGTCAVLILCRSASPRVSPSIALGAAILFALAALVAVAWTALAGSGLVTTNSLPQAVGLVALVLAIGLGAATWQTVQHSADRLTQGRR